MYSINVYVTLKCIELKIQLVTHLGFYSMAITAGGNMDV